MKALKFPYFTLLAAITSASTAELLVYEGFQYSSTGNSLAGQPDNSPEDSSEDIDATGLSGTWADSLPNQEMFLKEGNLIFSDLATNGNHIGFLSNQSNDIFHRPLASPVTDAISTAGSNNRSLYFSFLFEKLQNNFGAAHEGLAIMNGILPSSRWDSGNPGAVGTHGFAVAAVAGDNLQAVAYDGTTGTQVVGEEFLPISVVNGSTNTETSNVAVNFIVGEILFNTGVNGADIFSLYNVTDDGELSEDDLTLIDTIEADVDESLLTILNVTRQVNVNYDEIRIGESLADVFPAGPGPVEISITSINLVSPGLFELTLTGTPNSAYELVASDSLDFPNGTVVSGISQGDPADPGIVSGPENSVITPDENGDATIRITLTTADKGFVRVQETP